MWYGRGGEARTGWEGLLPHTDCGETSLYQNPAPVEEW